MNKIKFTFVALSVSCLLLTGCASSNHAQSSRDYTASAGAASDSGLSGSVEGAATSSGARDYAEVLAHPGVF